MKTRLATPESRSARLADLRELLSIPRRWKESGGPAIKRFLHDYADDVVAIRALIELLLSAKMPKEADRIAADAQSRLGLSSPLLIGIAQICAQTGQPGRAHAALLKAIELSPQDVDAYCQLGSFYLARREFAGAIDALRKACKIAPDSYDAQAGLAQALQRCGRPTLAIGHYQKALAIRPEAADCRCALGVAQALIGDLDEALVSVRAARAKKPDFSRALATEAEILITLNHQEEALALLAPALSGIRPHPALASAFARAAAEAGRLDHAIALCGSIVADGGLRDSERAPLQFSLGALYEKKGDFDAAFEAFQRGNRLSGTLEYDRSGVEGYVDRIISSFAKANLNKLARGSDQSKLPIFIVGMPRSGTSLVEQILASHPQVFGAGELPDIGQLVLSASPIIKAGPYPDCMVSATPDQINKFSGEHLATLRELGGLNTRVTDRMAGNFQHVGLIRQLFPGARVIHCRRDSIDSCLDCYTTMFSAAHVYARDLAHLGHYYRQYERLMAFWQQALDVPILDMQYEELVSVPEPHIRKLVEFCGLPWDDACLRFHESKRVACAARMDQIRRSFDLTSINRARHYAAHLAPLRAALARSPE